MPDVNRLSFGGDMNYEKLWKDLKADLERWNQVGGHDEPDELAGARDFWELMQKTGRAILPLTN